jgi:hypothetical protein
VKVGESREASLGVKLLGDLREVFGAAEADRLATDDILDRLHGLAESPWGDLRGKPLDARGLARRLRQYEVHPHQFKVGDAKVRGYSIPGSDTEGGGLHDAFGRYLPLPEGPASGTDGTSGTGQVSALDEVPDKGPGTGCENLSGTPDKPLTREVPDVPDVPDNTGQPDEQDASLVPTLTAPCPICQAPPPRRGSFGIIACEHQIAAGLVPA